MAETEKSGRDRRDIEFTSGGVTLRGWLLLPEAPGPNPLVILAHGMGGLKEWTIPDVATALVDMGFAALAFDYRNFGDSEGLPREEVDHCGQVEDWRCAITLGNTLPEIDADRIGIWGTSLGGRNVLAVAALDRRVKCVVAQVPAIAGDAMFGALMVSGGDIAAFHRALSEDRTQRALGGEPRYVIFENDPATEHGSYWGDLRRGGAPQLEPSCDTPLAGALPGQRHKASHATHRAHSAPDDCGRPGHHVPDRGPAAGVRGGWRAEVARRRERTPLLRLYGQEAGGHCRRPGLVRRASGARRPECGPTMSEVWILGAAGRTGRAIAADLSARQVPLVLVGRDARRMHELAEACAGVARAHVAGSVGAIAEALAASKPAVVVNTIGPFAETAAPITRACAPHTHYLDIGNELDAAIELLGMNDEAARDGRCVVTGAGWGVLATESVVLSLCENQPRAARVRVDAMPFVDSPGLIGPTLAATIIEGLPAGGRRYQSGRLVRANLGGDFQQLVLPDGSSVATGAVPTADLEAARRASGASDVVAASGTVPSARLVRALMPIVPTLFSLRSVREFAKRRVAAIRVAPIEGPPKSSWAHAKVHWANGRVREGWLRAGDAMSFTTRVAAEVAIRLARGEGRPGVFTPGALFGPGLAVVAGGVFVLD